MSKIRSSTTDALSAIASRSSRVDSGPYGRCSNSAVEPTRACIFKWDTSLDPSAATREKHRRCAARPRSTSQQERRSAEYSTVVTFNNSLATIARLHRRHRTDGRGYPECPTDAQRLSVAERRKRCRGGTHLLVFKTRQIVRPVTSASSGNRLSGARLLIPPSIADSSLRVVC